MTEIHNLQIDQIVTRALEEDWGHGDWTTDICVPAQQTSRARIIAKDEVIVAGVELVKAVFAKVDPLVKIWNHLDNGAKGTYGDEIFTFEGRSRSILKAERVALNFLGRLSGIATHARRFVDAMEGTGVQLLDTRKTTPGLRLIEKSATVIGGARNHRMCLTDGVIVKENHIRAAGGITAALDRLTESLPPTLKIEVEVTNLEEVQEAIDAGADLIMLDNMSPAEMELAVRTARGRVKTEASGNVTIENVRQIAETGVDFISTSAILHSSPWSDYSLLFDL